MSENLRRAICRAVMEEAAKIPVRELLKRVSLRIGVPGSTVREAVRGLVGEGTLTYTNHYGTSFLEASYDRPVRISGRVVIKPPQQRYRRRPGDVVIALEKGAAFGEGGHPTTRLVLDALDHTLTDVNGPSTGLDVGTGTGILAIALAKLGVKKIVGTDIDPCAISEARQNVALNGLDGWVSIVDRPLEGLEGDFSVVVANLAFPTIKNMAKQLVRLTASTGFLMLSGFRSEVLCSVRNTFEPKGMRLYGEKTLLDWACTIWTKP